MEKIPEIFCKLPPGGVDNGQPPEVQSISGAAAQVATNKLWPIKHGKDVLHFHIKNHDKLVEVGLNDMNIKSWAAIWNHDREYPNIPKLQLTGDCDKADIRIKIVPNGFSWSMMGTDAENITKYEPTMVLGLKKGRNSYNEHIVIHEFGHALGLEHEHQRSKFWSVAEKFIDKKKMKDDIDIVNYLVSDQIGAGSEEYDPDSVMHYWFDKKWLIHEEYKDKKKVKDDPDLSPDDKKVLLGIHKRQVLAAQPSPTDLKFLDDCYKSSTSDAASPPTPTPNGPGDYYAAGPTMSTPADSPNDVPMVSKRSGDFDYSQCDCCAHHTMVKCCEKLSSAMSQDPKALADALRSEGFISQSTLDETNQRQDETKMDKGRRLYRAVSGKVQHYPKKHFPVFIEILRKEEIYIDILNEIYTVYSSTK